MKLTVVGSGDAFGSGGRLQACFHVQARTCNFLVDCGASSLLGLRKFDLDPGGIDIFFITHLHGDHFGGLPFFLIDALYLTKREAPLVLVGPAGLEKRLNVVMEAFYPGALAVERKFELRFVELEERVSLTIQDFRVTPYPVVHPCGAPPYALRFELDNRIVAFSGDTGWTDNLIEAGRDADLFVCECCQFDKKLKLHLDYETIAANIQRIAPKHTLLTHMNEAMLKHAEDIDKARFATAYDGMVLEL